MRNTRDCSITHKLAKMSFDQIIDLTAGVYFYIIIKNENTLRLAVRSKILSKLIFASCV